jgi:hypothetical protein
MHSTPTQNIPALLQKRRADAKLFPALPVPFPPCSDVMLSRPHDGQPNTEIRDIFEEYFGYGHYPADVPGVDPALLACLEPGPRPTAHEPEHRGFPPAWCLPPSCVTLNGRRGDGSLEEKQPLRRLFFGDLIWLFYMERMGIFKMLGAILDDFAIGRKYPFRIDNLQALILEAMVRQTKAGLSSTVRDRDITYRACLGWSSEAGAKVATGATLVNRACNVQLNLFIQLASELYRDRRLAVAIRNAPSVQSSVATLKAISETIDVLRIAFDPFKYGRNYAHTLAGIVWAMAGLILVRDLRPQLGIQTEYEQPSRYMQVAYDLLVGGGASTGDSNRYSLHKECADRGRNLALDLEVVNHKDANPGGELEQWLNSVEDDVEGYRTTYKSLTGIDLGAPGAITVEQQA